ncbi:MAG: hypothetical protein JXA33_05185 [Anaerolineae bacterium]|nr:hypothetical protein [Anaerolineae bacterium]
MLQRRLLIIDTAKRSYELRTLPVGATHNPREDYGLLSGESLCQYLLREDPGVLVIVRGPLPFLPGNKTTVGYISPLTGVPHYSYVGGRGFAHLFNLGLDAIVLHAAEIQEKVGFPFHHSAALSPCHPLMYLVISGRVPHLHLEWKSAIDLPTGQRSAFYWLLEHELGGVHEAARASGSIFTVGEAARYGYRIANLGCDGIYHAGRGGAGYVFAHKIAALVLRGDPKSLDVALGARADAFRDLRNGELQQRLAKYCERLSRRDGGTVTKLYATGTGDAPTLPARNAQRLGYNLADLGARNVLKASRVGQTGCHWCQVNCRHWHWVDVTYAPDGRDMYLDDFEPTYALFAMLDLQPEDDSLKARLRLLDKVDRHIVVYIEELGGDVIDIGVGLAALFEGLECGLIPLGDVPPFLHEGPYLGNLDLASQVVLSLRQGTSSIALRALGDGPQALAEQYPALKNRVFTSGSKTLGNPGHGNALWTFLMPFSRFFSHYSGQIYKVPGSLTPDMNEESIHLLFERVIREMLKRETFGCLGNALSLCGFTFVIFSEKGQGISLDRDDLLVRTLATYGIEMQREDLEWFAEAFWAQSIALKLACGWHPPTAADFPARIFEMLAQTLPFKTDVLRTLMEQLIIEWRRQANALLRKYGYEIL